MGCQQGKLAEKPPEENGHMENVPEYQEPPPTDPRLPLTAREVFKLQKSWKGIKRNMEATGVEMFIRFFQQNEDIKTLFKDFKDINNMNTMYENEALLAHGQMVMGAIDDVISNIQDVDAILARMDTVGSSHCRFAGFTSDLFYRMEIPFLDAVKTILEDRYTEQMDGIYRTTIKFIVTKVSEGHQGSLQQSAAEP